MNSHSPPQLCHLREITVNDESAPPDAISQNQVLAPTTRKRQLTVLISCFVAVVMTIGPNQAYGVFQQFYVTSPESILPPSEAQNRGVIALVGTLAAGLTWGGSIVVNALMSRVSGNANQKIATVGVVVMSLGYGLAGSCSRVSNASLDRNIQEY